MLAALLTMMCAACETSPSKAPLAVNIPNECDRNAGPVSLPADGAGVDIRAIAAHYAAKLGLANQRLTKRRVCEADVRAKYAKP